MADTTTLELEVGRRAAMNMKVSLAGRYTVDELGDALDRVLQTFRMNGVDEIRSVTCYFHLYADRVGLELLDDAGAPIRQMTFEAPRGRHFRPVSWNPRLGPPDQQDPDR